MANHSSHLPGSRLEPAERILKAALHHWGRSETDVPAPVSAANFITISRQPGCGADPFSHRLAERLSQMDGHWSAWDNELLEKVSQEHGIAANILELIERRHTWLENVLQSLSITSAPDVQEVKAYKQVVVTVRALAEAGRAIIVSEGGAFITENLSGGVHVRLIAPLQHRIQYFAATRNLPVYKAAQQIVDMQQRRSGFYHQYWSGKTLSPEEFTITLNTAQTSLDEMVECIAILVHTRHSADASFLNRQTMSLTH